jgi:hypothetical protein
MSAAIMRDTPVATLGQKEHLVFEGIRRERPAMAEDDCLTLSPVLVVDVYVAGFFLTYSYEWHF